MSKCLPPRSVWRWIECYKCLSVFLRSIYRVFLNSWRVFIGSAFFAVALQWKEYSRKAKNDDHVRDDLMRCPERSHKLVIMVKRSYRQQYGYEPPLKPTIREWLKKFLETGSVCYSNREMDNHDVSDERVKRESFQHCPRKPPWHTSRELNPSSTVSFTNGVIYLSTKLQLV